VDAPVVERLVDMDHDVAVAHVSIPFVLTSHRLGEP
jgi:hypothetical protein